jgi:MFS family permease
MSGIVTSALVFIGWTVSIYLAGRIAERRGRRFKKWAWIAAAIGPLALPLVLLFPNLHGKNGGEAR